MAKKTIKELELELQRAKTLLGYYLEKVTKIQADIDAAKKAEADKKDLVDKKKNAAVEKELKLNRVIAGYSKTTIVEPPAPPKPQDPPTPPAPPKPPEPPIKKGFLDRVFGWMEK